MDVAQLHGIVKISNGLNHKNIINYGKQRFSDKKILGTEYNITI